MLAALPAASTMKVKATNTACAPSSDRADHHADTGTPCSTSAANALGSATGSRSMGPCIAGAAIQPSGTDVMVSMA